MYLASRTACAVLVVCLLSSLSAIAAEHTKDSLKDVQSNVEKKKAVLVDVRENKEWTAGHIEGAVPLPLSELKRGTDREMLAARLPTTTILYTHCEVGKRSVTAANILKEYGYDVRPLKAGYKDLLQAGFKKAKMDVASPRE
jgi:rhodanese-related sulfurtransferase